MRTAALCVVVIALSNAWAATAADYGSSRNFITAIEFGGCPAPPTVGGGNVTVGVVLNVAEESNFTLQYWNATHDTPESHSLKSTINILGQVETFVIDFVELSVGCGRRSGWEIPLQRSAP
eukprot:Selendium_serpulae@DN6522_c7_g2_i20.p1